VSYRPAEPRPSTPAGTQARPAEPGLPHGSVVVAIVTWRRPELLRTALASLGRQSRPADHLVVVDNDADPAVAEVVAAFPGPSTYLSSRRNLGSAGGFALGALTALALGASWVWFLDDDGRPATDDCLRELLACAATRRLEMVAPVVVTAEDPMRLSFLMRKGLRWARRIDELGEHEFLPNHVCLFNGTLISAEALDVIGVPDYRLFLRGEEVEFHRRALRAGIRFGTCLTTAFLHPSGAQEFHPIFGGWVRVQDPVEPGKRYYTFRNRGYVSTQPGRRLRWPLELACVAWYFLVLRRDPGELRTWLRLARLGRHERLLRRPGQ
jgi:rhamnopyranosyl-N-acetylglucosaminyl-diphospho-decaprenol beta-1,3/1,4-galactofuranosyltransferase